MMSRESDIADLKRRVTALENESLGQQRFNARFLEMLTELRDDVGILRRHAVATGQKVESLDHKVESLAHKVESLDRKVDSLGAQLTMLRNDLPGIVAAAVAPLLGKERP